MTVGTLDDNLPVALAALMSGGRCGASETGGEGGTEATDDLGTRR